MQAEPITLIRLAQQKPEMGAGANGWTLRLVKRFSFNSGIVGRLDNLSFSAAEFAISQARKHSWFTSTSFKLSKLDDACQFTSTLNMETVALVEGSKPPFPSCAVSTINQQPMLKILNENQEQQRLNRCSSTLSLVADLLSFGLATHDFIKQKGFKKLALLHDDKHVHMAMELQLSALKNVASLHFFYLNTSVNVTQMTVKEVITEIEQLEIYVILLITSKEYWPLVLREQSYNHEKPFVWIILSEVPNSVPAARRNVVLGFRLKRVESSGSLALIKHLSKKSKDDHLTLQNVKESVILMYDAVTVLIGGIADAIRNNDWVRTNASSALPRNRKTLHRYLKQIRINGASGEIVFDGKGRRSVKHLDLLSLRDNIFIKIGTWSSDYGAKLEEKPKMNNDTEPLWKRLENRHLRVVTVEEHPFVFLKYDKNGREYYEGYCIDIVKKLSEMLGFTYELRLSYDKTFGYKRKGKWTGAIKEIIEKTADMISTSMTVTEERAKVVAFTRSYMTFTEFMLKKRTQTDQHRLLQFTEPFTDEVWQMLFASIVVFALCLFAINYLSHSEVRDKTGRFSLANSLWLSLAFMLQQGGETSPRSVSGRLLTVCFWFGVLIWVSTYTANMAALFTVRKASVAVSNLEEAMKSDHTLGVTRGESLYSFLKEAKYELYQRIWNKMESRHSFSSTSADGIRRARREPNYIHIGDRPVLKYAANRKPCNLEIIPGIMETKSLSFALNLADPATHNLSLAMLRLREQEFFSRLEEKWWDDNNQCQKEHKKDRDPITRKIKISSMAGVFIVFALGACAAFITLVVEIMLHKGIIACRACL